MGCRTQIDALPTLMVVDRGAMPSTHYICHTGPDAHYRLTPWRETPGSRPVECSAGTAGSTHQPLCAALGKLPLVFGVVDEVLRPRTQGGTRGIDREVHRPVSTDQGGLVEPADGNDVAERR